MLPERVNIIVARVEEYQILLPGRVEELSRGNNKHLQRQLRRQHHLLNPQWEMTGTENISLDSVSQHTERTEANRLYWGLKCIFHFKGLARKQRILAKIGIFLFVFLAL